MSFTKLSYEYLHFSNTQKNTLLIIWLQNISHMVHLYEFTNIVTLQRLANVIFSLYYNKQNLEYTALQHKPNRIIF